MSDYLAVEHNVETGETVEHVMTQLEIDALMATFVGITEATTIESDNEPMPFEPAEPNPLPEDTEP